MITVVYRLLNRAKQLFFIAKLTDIKPVTW